MRDGPAGGNRGSGGSLPVRLVALTAVALAACGDRGGWPEGALEPGVTRTLAEWRAAAVEDVRYDLSFHLPGIVDEPVRGRAEISFRLSDTGRPLPLDFEGPEGGIRSLSVNGEAKAWERRTGHLLLSREALRRGENRVEVQFTASDGPLNRNPEFLYTLFVPARAHEAFPCFDQPDLKARFGLALEIPPEWEAAANGREVERKVVILRTAKGETKDRIQLRFATTPPLPTYLFAFAAGRFEVETAERDGRELTMLHREPDTATVARNRERIFDLHATALEWLEEYTGIPYPFDEFAFVAVPSFQYGGMEHPGTVFYRSDGLFLDESPTKDEELGRASVIAHETAHMWFGDLVTMRWFDDVWMKEVFANFMAAKIVHPSFPELNHDLRFLLDHYPAAYSVDRTEGTHPVRQELGNLSDAGSLYGAVIYEKAPIVVSHLERLIGEETIRTGLRAYLEGHRFGNAGWPELIRILDERTGEDLERWSRVWVEEAGRPTVRATVVTGGPDSAPRVRSLLLHQSDPMDRSRRWNQRLQPALGYGTELRLLPAHLRGETAAVAGVEGADVPTFVLPNGGGKGYGRFALDAGSRMSLLGRLPHLPPPVTRAAAWLALWDEMLHRAVEPERLLEALLRALPREREELIVARLLDDLEELWWRYLTADQRRERAARVERLLWRGMGKAEEASLKASYFRAYRSVALTDAAVDRLRRVWGRQEPPAGLALSERDYMELAQELAVREAGGEEGARRVLERQLERISNPDRRERFAWVMPSLSPRKTTRDSFFAALSEVESRRRERWVTEGVSWLHHPLRSEASREYVRPALELVEEIQATGDIFFPRRWLDATLHGHSSPEVAETVRRFLADRPDFPSFLRDKVLQAADPVFRAAVITAAP